MSLRGRVVAEAIGGLPGEGLEGLWIGVHAVGDRAVNLASLPPPVVEGETTVGGSFALIVSGTTELLVVVRERAGGELLAAQRVSAASLDGELQLLVPRD